MVKREISKFIIAIIIFVILILIVTGGLVFKSNYAKRGVQAECITNDDCIKKQITCCPCSAGGKETCIAKTNNTYLDKIKTCPDSKELICLQVYNCGSQQCICNKGRCEG